MWGYDENKGVVNKVGSIPIKNRVAHRVVQLFDGWTLDTLVPIATSSSDQVLHPNLE